MKHGHLFQLALHRLGTRAENTLAVGDRLETDISGGKKADLSTALVLTGISQREDLEVTDIQPDWVFENLGDLTSALVSHP